MLPGGNSWEGGDNFGQGVISADCHVQGHRRSHSAGNEATQTLELAAGGGKPVDSGGNYRSRVLVRLDDIPAVVDRQCVVERSDNDRKSTRSP